MTTEMPPAILDDLADLLARQDWDLLRYLSGAEPYVGNDPRPRRIAQAMIESQDRRERQLADLIDAHGGGYKSPITPADMQYLSFLSAPYLLPRLIESRRKLAARYRAALAREGIPADIAGMLKAHLAEIEQEVVRLGGND